MDGVYKFADKIVQICTICDYTHKMCKNYKSDGTPEFVIATTESDIERERKKSEVKNAPNGYFESLAVYRQLADGLSSAHRILFHGSAIAVDNEAYLFTAPSGTGKSTHTALWRELFGERAFMVNDDKPLIRIENGVATVYGTPWNGKHHLSRNVAIPLKGIAILGRAEQNSIERVDANSVYIDILRQTHLPKNPEQSQFVLQSVDDLLKAVPIYKLKCNMMIDAAQTAYNGMKG